MAKLLAFSLVLLQGCCTALEPSAPPSLGMVPPMVHTPWANAQVGIKSDDAAAKPAAKAGEQFQFQADVNKLMDIIINSLYSKKEIFLRELISNGSDALDKVRFMSLTDPSVLGDGDASKLEMKLIADKEAKTLTLIDTGCGMTKEDLINHLGTVAQSGTSSFIEAFSEGADVNLIGQFGVGFYSVYLVADSVAVTSKSNEDDKQWTWESTADSTFSVSEDPEGASLGRGTRITLSLKEDCLEFLEEERLKGLIKRYSEFINFPIYLYTTKEEEEEVPIEEGDEEEEEEDDEEEEEEEDAIEDAEEDEEEEDDAPKTKTIKKTVNDWELINDAKALWTRNPSDITDEEYKSFYQSLTKDFGEPLTHTHFSAEGEVEFKSILFIPGEAPYDLYNDYYKKQNNLKLYVRRVMITDEFDELLPKYLGFIKGVVDSDSLPLNVSREMLQQNKVLKVIGKKMTRKALAMIKSLADAEKKDDDDEDDEDGEAKESKEDEEEEDEDEDQGKYVKFWKAFGKYIKMGLIEDSPNRTRLAKLLRYSTSKSGDKEISLEEYVANMKEDQKNIYYITGDDKASLLKSPSVEKLLAKDIEVIFMTDSVDEYTVQHLTEYEGKRLINASREGLKLEEGDKEKKVEAAYKEQFKPLLDYAKETLGKRAEKVSISKHLVQSPVVVLSADYGWTAQMEKVMKSQAFADNSKYEFMKSKRMFELNPRHPMIIKLNEQVVAGADDNTKNQIMSLYLAAVIAAGYQLTPEDAAEFSTRVTGIVTESLGVAADAELVPEIEVPDDVEEEAEEEAAEAEEEEEQGEGVADKEEL
jgi:heat shock protein beta